MIRRPDALASIRKTLRDHPIAAVLGPRQCGKTTLARQLAAEESSTYFDLENPVDAARLSAPMTVLEALDGLVVIDEVQRRPDIFALLRALVDRVESRARFLLLASASPDLVKGASESLAGRIGFVDLGGFDLLEVRSAHHQQLWQRGGFPRSYLADNDADSLLWREDFIGTFLERDLPQLGINVPAETMRRFWTMIAHHHGQVWNAAELARSLGTAEATARRYLEILAGAYMVRILPPWHENLGKRQVKSPKVFLRDSGLLHALLQLGTLAELQSHPKLSASWEGFAMEQVISQLDTRDTYFWATHAGAELDLLVLSRARRYGFEFKYADAPRASRSMHIAIDDLGLEHLWVVYPGRQAYPITERITALPIQDLPSLGNDLLSDAGADD